MTQDICASVAKVFGVDPSCYAGGEIITKIHFLAFKTLPYMYIACVYSILEGDQRKMFSR